MNGLNGGPGDGGGRVRAGAVRVDWRERNGRASGVTGL